MEVFVDPHGGLPIYAQIRTQLRSQILSGALPEGAALPSIRGLAKDLRVSVITVKRAYEELEQEGLIYTMPAKGCFVAEPARWPLEARPLLPHRTRTTHLEKDSRIERMDAVVWGLEMAVNIGRQGGMSDRELRAALEQILDELPNPNQGG